MRVSPSKEAWNSRFDDLRAFYGDRGAGNGAGSRVVGGCDGGLPETRSGKYANLPWAVPPWTAERSALTSRMSDNPEDDERGAPAKTDLGSSATLSPSEELPPPSVRLVGTRLGHFRIVAELGRGG